MSRLRRWVAGAVRAWIHFSGIHIFVTPTPPNVESQAENFRGEDMIVEGLTNLDLRTPSAVESLALPLHIVGGDGCPVRAVTIEHFPESQEPMMSQPTFAIAVSFEIKPENAEQFCSRVLQQAADSVNKEPGCHQFDVLRDESNPNVFFLYETYLNAAAFNDHRQTPHFADFSQAIADWVVSKNVHRLTLLENKNT